MRKLHILIPSILVASSMPMVSMVGCNKEVVHVTGVNIQQQTIKRYINERIHKKVKYTISPDNATDKAVAWTIADPTIATITEDGTVTPLKEGSTTITITTHDGEYTDSCNLVVNADPANEPLTFIATTNCNFSIYHTASESITQPIPNLQYSINGREWIDYTMPVDSEEYGIEIPLESGNIIQFQGDNPNGFCYYNSGSDYSFWNFRFYNDDDLDCGDISGNVMSLLSKDNFISLTTIPCDGCFYSLFESSYISDASSLILPAMVLTKRCYYSMFSECPVLTTAPEQLPATTLADNCYKYMFGWCNCLTTPPELLAKTLAEDCYNGMFYYCKSLTTAPALSATSLAKNCYVNMFNYCTSLTSAPLLPATELAESCYETMFFGCISLTTAPNLLAGTLAKGCYYSMFFGCSSLTNVQEELPATTLAEECYDGMFYACGALTTTPKLPATNLAAKCYHDMFASCTSLTTAPELPATILPEKCYDGMFVECHSLKIRQQDTKTIDEGFIFTCPNMWQCDDMFTGCNLEGFHDTPENGKSYYWYT